MRTLYDIPAPAKLNLFLHITGRRSDGYHLLQSVFMLIDWCDTLHFERRAGAEISREDLIREMLNHSNSQIVQRFPRPLPADDLSVRAARALQTATGCRQGVHISLHKRIPVQAGMGGGSSDAASTLLALNRLWGLHLPLTQLAAIGLTLGADVPFFLYGRNAWVEGIGDVVCPLPAQHQTPPARFVVVKPTAGLDTWMIFSHPLLRRDCDCATISGFAAAHYQFGSNALQSVAEALCPDVGHALHWLASKGLRPRMTGSGSAVFAQITHTVDLSDAPTAWQVKVCENLQTHPLCGWVAEEKTATG